MNDNAQVKIFPPLIFLLPAIIGTVLQLLVPLYIFPVGLARFAIGGLLIILGISFLSWAMNTLRNADTAIHPDHTTNSVVVEGPFKFTRNPMYVSFSVVYLGLTALINTWWMAFFFPLIIPILFYAVISREEEYLKEKFGAQYEQYQQSVGRWF
ncbi:MAG: isoprenylcysteine carboxylmethyltransferase family protein [Candidatus Paceibacterota bacterium]